MEVIDVKAVAKVISDLRKIKRAKISLTQMIALLAIRAGIATDMKGVAGACEVTTAAGTGVVDALAKLGFVERAADELDRRKTKVALTLKGMEEVPWPS